MASTYSSFLRLELMADGDQQGAWGQTTNKNLQTVIEAAIAGYTTVSVTSANQALTANNAVTDQARSAMLKLTTSTAANFAIYAPPAGKSYTIYNSTAYVATIYNSTVLGNTSAAGTGVAIPAGATVSVVSDGTNYTVANSYLPSLTLGAPLAKAYGGTGGTGGGVPAGAMLDYGGTTAPAGGDWLLCDGASYTTAAQPTLFAAIGYTHGGSGGNFNVPDTRRRVTMGSGGTAVSGPGNAVGNTGGAETVTLASANLPAHAHGINFTSGIENQTHSHTDSGHSHLYDVSSIQSGFGSGGNLDHPAGAGAGYTTYNTRTSVANLGTETANHTHNIVGNTDNGPGTATALTNVQPTLVVLKIIKT